MNKCLAWMAVCVVVLGNVCVNAAEREWIDFKRYACGSVEQRDALMALFDQALIPALNRQGVKSWHFLDGRHAEQRQDEREYNGLCVGGVYGSSEGNRDGASIAVRCGLHEGC